MAYVPLTEPWRSGDAMAPTKWTTQIDNHQACFDDWLPLLISANLDGMTAVTFADGTTTVMHWFRRDNFDELPYRVTIFAKGLGTFQVHTDTASSPVVNVTNAGSFISYTTSVTPDDASGPAFIEVTPSSGNTIEVQGVVIQYDSVTFSTGTQTSGAVVIPAGLLTTADNAIGTEHVARLANLPGQMARARRLIGGAMHKFTDPITIPLTARFVRDAVIFVAGEDRGMDFDVYVEGIFNIATLVIGGVNYPLSIGWNAIEDVFMPRGLSSGTVMMQTKALYSGTCHAIQAWR